VILECPEDDAEVEDCCKHTTYLQEFHNSLVVDFLLLGTWLAWASEISCLGLIHGW